MKGNLTSRLGRSPKSFMATGSMSGTMLREGSLPREPGNVEIAVN